MCRRMISFLVGFPENDTFFCVCLKLMFIINFDFYDQCPIFSCFFLHALPFIFLVYQFF